MELYSYVENRETTVRVRTAFHANHREFAIRNTHTAGHGAHAVERGAARAHGARRRSAHRQSPDAKPKAPPHSGVWACGPQCTQISQARQRERVHCVAHARTRAPCV